MRLLPFLLLFICTNAYALPFRSIQWDEQNMTITIERKSGEFSTYSFNDAPGATLEEKAQWVENELEEYFLVKTKRSSLPQDDERRQSDPGLSWHYWQGGDVVEDWVDWNVWIDGGGNVQFEATPTH